MNEFPLDIICGDTIGLTFWYQDTTDETNDSSFPCDQSAPLEQKNLHAWLFHLLLSFETNHSLIILNNTISQRSADELRKRIGIIKTIAERFDENSQSFTKQIILFNHNSNEEDVLFDDGCKYIWCT